MVFNNLDDVKVGSTSIAKVYRGSSLIWQAGTPPTPAPEWPAPFYYPDNIYQYSTKGIAFFYINVSSGHSFNFDMYGDDCEGEGGGHNVYLGNDLVEGGRSQVYSFTASKSYSNTWLSFLEDWEFYCNNYGNLLSGATAMALWAKRRDCGSYYELPTGITYTNIRLLVIPYFDSGLAAPIREVIANCPNLMYLALDSAGTFSGETFTLTGSTAWTAESMKFTEWYCPGTTFIVNDNSYWRNIIDWDIAQQRNVTFKDTNGNIMHG